MRRQVLTRGEQDAARENRSQMNGGAVIGQGRDQPVCDRPLIQQIARQLHQIRLKAACQKLRSVFNAGADADAAEQAPLPECLEPVPEGPAFGAGQIGGG